MVCQANLGMRCRVCLEAVSEEGTQWKVDPFVLDPEMTEDTVKTTNETIKEKTQVNLITNNCAGSNAPLIAEEIADRL